ncbi:MFS transporter [Smaragdicoccus niigatensis]|uniref:MFS transporter n=1 Tax=Smaragdicoccus niigatensis TaxID=359359 RepID=UPI0003654AF6|nr:MFS transporter [Smaragdicoccus niigatensis]
MPALPLLVIGLFGFFVAAAAPSPLLVPFQHELGFSPAMLTIIFATYAIALMATLLVAGGLSDHVGRKPVIIGALVVEALSMLIFLYAKDVGWLLAGRAVQGIATGIALGAFNAAILENSPAGSRVGALANGFAPLGGLAAGGLVTGWIIQQFHNPVHITFISLAVFFALAALAAIPVTRTTHGRPGALKSLVPRLSMPPAARGTFLAVLPAIIALWSISGLYLSLVSPAMITVFDLHLGLAGGLAIGLFNASGAVAPLLLRKCAPATITVTASCAMAIGSVGVAASVALGSVPLFFVSTVVAGSGFGLAFSASARQVMEFVGGHERAATFAFIYVVSYIAFSVPAMIAGSLVHTFGLDTVLLTYTALTTAISIVGIITTSRERRREFGMHVGVTPLEELRPNR